jgi:hypothetical protein
MKWFHWLYPIALILIMGSLIVLTDCQRNTAPEPVSSNDMTYFRDGRTGLCFASVNSVGYGGVPITSIANVPCTEDVMKAIGDRP